MSDTSLITLVTNALTASGLPTSVQPGPLCFPRPCDDRDKTTTDKTLDQMWMASEEEFAWLKQKAEHDLDDETLATSSLNIEVNLKGLEVDEEVGGNQV